MFTPSQVFAKRLHRCCVHARLFVLVIIQAQKFHVPMCALIERESPKTLELRVELLSRQDAPAQFQNSFPLQMLRRLRINAPKPRALLPERIIVREADSFYSGLARPRSCEMAPAGGTGIEKVRIAHGVYFEVDSDSRQVKSALGRPASARILSGR